MRVNHQSGNHNETSEEKQFRIELKQKLANLLSSIQIEFQTWLNSDDGQSLQNSLVSIGSLLDFRFFGGLIYSYLPNLMNLDKRERFSTHMQDIANNLTINELNRELVKSPLGRSIMEETIRTILDEINNEKIVVQKSFLLNSYTSTDSDQLLLESFQRILTNADPSELLILKICNEPEETVKQILHAKAGNADQLVNVNILACLGDYLKIDNDLCEVAIKKLQSNGLLDANSGDLPAGGYFKGNYTNSYPELAKRMKKLLTPLATKFLQSITIAN